MKAAFVLEDKTLIDIVDLQTAYFHRTNERVSTFKQRGRISEKLAKEFGFKEVRVISLLEMDYMKDEAEFLTSRLFK
jgi:IMP cyclohydrolase